MNFNQVINRKQTNCFKWDMNQQIFGQADVLPLWVADMDFSVADCIQEAIVERTKHTIYGYTFYPESYYEAFINWQKRRFNWHIQREWLLGNPALVPAINIAIQTFTEKNDKILIQTPVYHPFIHSVKNNQRTLLISELILRENHYMIDFNDLEKQFRNGVKMMLLCSPHNPVGRVWKQEELEKLLYLAKEYNVLIVSDEIHADLAFSNFMHIPIQTIANHEQQIITLMSPGKVFNIAGICHSMAIIPNSKIRKKFTLALKKLHLETGTIFGITAFEAAYQDGENWWKELILYLEDNYDFLKYELNKKLPKIKLVKSEGTYLAWLDFREYGFSQKELVAKLVHEAKLGLNDGTIFGNNGAGFMRLNFGCPRSTLEDAVTRLKKTFN
jgi:cystathionine beta-lyase